MNVEGNTNVTSLLMGRGVVDGIAQSSGRFVVTTMDVPWQLTKDKLGSAPLVVQMVDSMEVGIVDQQIAELPDCDTVIAIGGGRAIDFGKYMAWRRRCRLITIPTVLSVDAFVTPKAGLRRDHQVEYVGDSTPNPLVIDFDLLRTAPRQLNIAGVGDLLSIHTATFDWELAELAGKSEFPFSKDDVSRARSILRDVQNKATEIRDCTDDGLACIVNGYMRVNTICLPADHYRVEEGSEHFLFYELEERLKRPFIHGQIVGLGIYVMSHLQHNAHDMVVQLIDTIGLDYRPASMDIPQASLVASLNSLPAYVRQRRMWYSVIDARPITESWIRDMCDCLY